VLVGEAKKADIEVSPIPGASAMISALSAAGIASDHFSFIPSRLITLLFMLLF
jgi:16S rRNA (cytidine1402-2'-O)-methyltransferase